MNGEGFKTGNEETDIANIDNTIKDFFYKVDLRKGLIAGEECWVKGKIGLLKTLVILGRNFHESKVSKNRLLRFCLGKRGKGYVLRRG